MADFTTSLGNAETAVSTAIKESVPIPGLFGSNTKSEGYLNAEANVLLSVEGLEGLSGFLFDVPESEKVDLSADITDHYVESGSFIQDHRVIKPVSITLSGFIGELIHCSGKGVSGLLGTLSNNLSAVPAFTGGYTPQAFQVVQKAAAQVRAAAALAENVIGTLGGVVQALSGVEAPTKQQVAYQKLKLLFESGVLLTLQTPWNYYPNLMITAISFSQSEESAESTNIKITLKEIRLATLASRTVTALDLTRWNAQNAPESDKKVTGGVPVAPDTIADSILYSIYNQGGS